MDIKPITREEMYLAKAAGQDVSLPEPITRKEMFLAKIAGMEVETPDTITRLEMFANKAAVALNRSVIEPLEITENGTYTAPEGVDGYSPVVVNVATASTDVRYVTFMSYDGSEEYGKKAVAVGDDCADPIARGVFDTPTKESTAQYNYTFAGWATEANGGLNENALKSVTEDRTVYANFISAVRYYTITYYDGDGTTVLKTESVAYGETPSYVPAKDGHLFAGWTPELVAVTENAEYTAQWEMAYTFADGSWDYIARVAESGQAANVFNLGDEKTVTFTRSGKTYDVTFVIVHFGDTECEDGSTAGITVLSKYALQGSYFGLSISDGWRIGTSKGWENSDARTSANSTGFGYLPSDLRAHIKAVKKITAPAGTTNTSAANVETIDKIWIPSVTEYGKTYSYTTKNQGFKFDGISKVGDTAYTQSLEVPPVISTSAGQHATRSPSFTGGSSFAVIINEMGSTTYAGVRFARMGFCI